jgi:hypothetical protein
MGMFDDVIVEGLKLETPKKLQKYFEDSNADLPKEFQTKDLNNCLSTYTIDSKGQIYLTEYKPTGKKVPYIPLSLGWTDRRSFLEKLFFKQIHRKHALPKFTEERKAVKTKTSLTQTFEIYTYIQVGGRYVDVTYAVTAAAGKVKSIKLTSWNIEDAKVAAKRHASEAEFNKNMEDSFLKRKTFQNKWYYPLVKETYNPFVFFTRMLVQKACHKIIDWSNRWHGV